MSRPYFVTPRPQIPFWAAEGVFLVLWGAAAPTALIASKALQIFIWLLPLASAAVIARGGLRLQVGELRPVHAVMLLPLVGLVSAIGSVDGAESVLRAIRLAGEMVALCLLITLTAVLPQDLRRRALAAIMVGVAIAAVIILLDVATAGALLTPLWGHEPSFEWRRIGYNRGETILAMLVPIIGVLALSGMTGRGWARGLGLAILMLGLVAGAVSVGASNSAKAALACGLGVFVLVYGAPVLLRFLLIAMALLTVAMPWLLEAVPPRPLIEKSGASLQSIVHRTIIWDFTIARIQERPLLGWGLDASRRMPGGDEKITVSGFNKAETGARQRVDITAQVMPLHPHNAVLQIWLELGALGATTVAGLIAFAAIRLPKLALGRAETAAVAASLTAGFIVSLVSYGFWQGWWLSALFLMATLPVLLNRSDAKAV